MYLSIIFFPFLGALFSGFLGRKLGVSGSQLVSCLSLLFSAILSSIAFYNIGLLNNPVSITLGSWIDSELMTVSWEFMFDQVSVVFCIMITYITFLILVYTVYYMEGNPHNQRFFSYLSAFAGFMLVLVTGANYFVLFVGWEGIGIVSYLLIGYFYTRIQATKAALLALTMNRLGDMFLSVGFFALFAILGSVDYSLVFNLTPYLNENAITIISLLLFGGAIAKSAQIPLSTWLPGSMEAFLMKLFPVVGFILIMFLINICLNLIFYYFTFFDLAQLLLKEEIYLQSVSILFYRSYIKPRDEKGRFISRKDDTKESINHLTKELEETLVGSLLGDGSLIGTHKDELGKIKNTTNCLYSVTLKSKNYIYYLWNIFLPIRTSTIPRPWPNPKKGLPIRQYAFNTRSLPILSLMHNSWYKWGEDNKNYTKIIPSDINELLTERGLAIWIMDDGFKVGNGVGLATECFSEEEIDRLKSVLENKFGLLVYKRARITSGGRRSYRLFISAKSRDKLHSLVLPYFIPEMRYKLNII
jgi:hypothetical protein